MLAVPSPLRPITVPPKSATRGLTALAHHLIFPPYAPSWIEISSLTATPSALCAL